MQQKGLSYIESKVKNIVENIFFIRFVCNFFYAKVDNIILNLKYVFFIKNLTSISRQSGRALVKLLVTTSRHCSYDNVLEFQ